MQSLETIFLQREHSKCTASNQSKNIRRISSRQSSRTSKSRTRRLRSTAEAEGLGRSSSGDSNRAEGRSLGAGGVDDRSRSIGGVGARSICSRRVGRVRRFPALGGPGAGAEALGGGGGGGGAGAAASGALALKHGELRGVLELARAVDDDQHAVTGCGGGFAGSKVAGHVPRVALRVSRDTLNDGGAVGHTVAARAAAEDEADCDAFCWVCLGVPGNFKGLALGDWVGEVGFDKRAPGSIGGRGKGTGCSNQAACNDEGTHDAMRERFRGRVTGSETLGMRW